MSVCEGEKREVGCENMCATASRFVGCEYVCVEQLYKNVGGLGLSVEEPSHTYSHTLHTKKPPKNVGGLGVSVSAFGGFLVCRV